MSTAFAGMSDEWRKYLEGLYDLEKKTICVKVDENAKYPDGTSVASAAAYNEYGTSTIPARPFMKMSFEQNEKEFEELSAEAVSGIADGDDLFPYLEKIGEAMQKAVQETIQSGAFVANADSTVARKGSSQPLIDTGLLKSSIVYEIEESA